MKLSAFFFIAVLYYLFRLVRSVYSVHVSESKRKREQELCPATGDSRSQTLSEKVGRTAVLLLTIVMLVLAIASIVDCCRHNVR